MFKWRKTALRERPDGMPLVLRTADEVARLAFPAETISSYRRMLTGLKYRGTIPHRLALVATLRGEGVTFSALALGTTLASDLNVRVCVVETNWWSPGMLKMLSQPAELGKRPRRRSRKSGSAGAGAELAPGLASPGLAAVLQGSATLDEALIATSQPNLALLPAGELPFEQRPVLARGEAIHRCFEELNGRFDHVVLDIPAVAVTSDAVALASLADSCCVVVHQGATPVTMVRQALDEVKHLPMLGVVLNNVRVHTPRWIFNLLPQE